MMEKLVLEQSVRINDQRIVKPYRVLTAYNTTEWKIGERLTRDEVKGIISRKGTGRSKVDVQIKLGRISS